MSFSRAHLGPSCRASKCDGYGAYKALRVAHSGVALAHCWAHPRRELLDIESAFPVEVAEIVGLIQKLYLVEKDIPRRADGDAERSRVRAASSADTVAEIFGWVVKTLPKQTPGNGLARAIGYLAGIWPGLLVFLGNPAVPLDNNAQRALDARARRRQKRSLRRPLQARHRGRGATLHHPRVLQARGRPSRSVSARSAARGHPRQANPAAA